MHFTCHCIILIVQVTLLITAENFKLYVIPDGMNMSHCPNYTGNISHEHNTVFCGHLSYYVKDSANYIKTNTSMIFLSGTHYLSNILIVSQIRNVSLMGHGVQGNCCIIIQCVSLHNSGIRFTNSTDINISQLKLVDCGTNDSLSTRNAMISHSALYFEYTVNLHLSHVTVMNSGGYGINCHSCCGGIVIDKTLFHQNQGNEYYIGGNSRFFYGDCDNISNSLNIQSSNFTNGLSYKKYREVNKVSGIELLSFCPALKVSISNAIVKSNLGGNLKFVMKDFFAQIWKINISDSVIADGRSNKGAGLVYTSKLYSPNYNKCHGPGKVTGNVLKISNTNFTGNSAVTLGGAVFISLSDSDCKPSNIEITKCYFVGNSVASMSPNYGKGAAIYISKHNIPGFYQVTVPVYTVNVTEGHFYDNHVIKSSQSSVLEVIRIESVNIKNSYFLRNNGTAISMKSSNVIATGTIVFKKNLATNGGALKFCESSSLFINNDTTVIFHNNHATQTGGAIFADQSCVDQSTPCFFQPNVNITTDVDDLKKENHMHLIFLNNSAAIAGDAIYGGNVDHCYTYRMFTSEHHNRTGFYLSKAIMNSTFFLDSDFKTSSLISSDAYGVYFCDENYNVDTINITATPGQMFNIKVRGAGQREGSAPAVIAAQLCENYLNTHLTQVSKYRPSSHCIHLNLTLITNQIGSTITLKIFVKQNEPRAVHRNNMFRYVSVHIKNCSWGFELNGNKCECAKIIQNYSIICNVNQQVLQKKAGSTLWIGCEHQYKNETCESLLVTKDCSRFQYCITSDPVNITANNWTSQCKQSRTGIACGHCQVGHSLPLGTSYCSLCSNAYLSLVLVYLSAGIILIVLLTSLNLTVANGSINSFLFYANFIYTSRAVFFIKEDDGNVIRILLAWINIDLGIEVCLYNGLDAYQKTWLEFLYIFYLWFLQGIIILMCRKYVFFTRICGRNVNKVMATLILLCVSKSCQAIVDTAQFNRMYTASDSHPIYIWSLDGTIRYYSFKHVVLLLVAFLVALVLLGFACCLLFIQILRKIAVLKLIKKLLPFFESYTGPCNHNYAFWPGFLMLTRGMIAAANTFFVDDFSQLGITIWITVSIIIMSFLHPLGVYKKWSLNLLELSFMLNLLILAAIIYAKPNVTFRSVLIHSSIVAAFSVFLAYNFWSPSKKLILKCIKNLAMRFRQINNQEGNTSLSNVVTCSEVTINNRSESETSPLLFQPPPRVDYNVLREPLMNSDSHS